MKQKTSRGSCGKIQKTVCLKETTERLTGGLHLSGLKFQTGENRARRRPRGAVVSDGDPRRGRGIGGYLRDQCTFPRLWVVVEVAGEHCVDGGPCSGGRRFGQSWISPKGAAVFKLKWGLAY